MTNKLRGTDVLSIENEVKIVSEGMIAIDHNIRIEDMTAIEVTIATEYKRKNGL